MALQDDSLRSEDIDPLPGLKREAFSSNFRIDSQWCDPDTKIVLENGGYVVTTLQAGLYHGLTAETATDAIVDAVMMGGDTDTIVAVAGAVAGARFGVDALPERWIEAIAEAEELRQLGGTLAEDSFAAAPAVEALCADGTLDL